MGAMNGGIPLAAIQEITRRYFEPLTGIDVEVHTFDPAAPDPLFRRLAEHSMTVVESPGYTTFEQC
jgi:hypothetical protein